MARKATDQVTTIAVGFIRNTGHLIALANVIGMSPVGQKRKSSRGRGNVRFWG